MQLDADGTQPAIWRSNSRAQRSQADVCIIEHGIVASSPLMAIPRMSARFRPPGSMKFCIRPGRSNGACHGGAIDHHRRRGRLSQQRARVKLTYDQPEAGAPATVIVKIEPPNELFRRMGEEFHAFEREIRFYRDVAGRVKVRLPKIYYTLAEAPDYRHRDGRFGLLHRRRSIGGHA